MSIDAALNLIQQMSQYGVNVNTTSGVYQAGSKQWIASKAEFDRANKVAMNAVGEEAVNIVKRYLSVPFAGVSSKPYESPKARTGSLRDSIRYRVGRETRQFPGPSKGQSQAKFASSKQYQWYNKINTQAYTDNSIITPYPQKSVYSRESRVIEVNPRAVDRSDRQRLEYYSHYLETGWYSRVNSRHLDKGSGSLKKQSVRRGIPSKKAKTNGPKWNPPRPYLRRLMLEKHKSVLLGVYRTVLARELPAALKGVAKTATLDIKYVSGLRVPFVSGNKNLLR